jgi:hypothetical protein
MNLNTTQSQKKKFEVRSLVKSLLPTHKINYLAYKINISEYNGKIRYFL